MNLISTMQFTAVRAVKLLLKLSLEILDELKIENDLKINELKISLEDLEAFLKREYSISVHLAPYVKYTNPLNEDKKRQLRKRILDTGNSLIREIETQV